MLIALATLMACSGQSQTPTPAPVAQTPTSAPIQLATTAPVETPEPTEIPAATTTPTEVPPTATTAPTTKPPAPTAMPAPTAEPAMTQPQGLMSQLSSEEQSCIAEAGGTEQLHGAAPAIDNRADMASPQERDAFTMRADSGFYTHGVRFSITIRQHSSRPYPRMRTPIPYWMEGAADVAETAYTPFGPRRCGSSKPAPGSQLSPGRGHPGSAPPRRSRRGAKPSPEGDGSQPGTLDGDQRDHQEPCGGGSSAWPDGSPARPAASLCIQQFQARRSLAMLDYPTAWLICPRSVPDRFRLQSA